MTISLTSVIYANEDFLAECGNAIANHGFAEYEFGSVNGAGWNGLSAISAVTLMNVGETDLSTRFRTLFGEATLDVWTYVSPDGHKMARACESANGSPIAIAFGEEEERRTDN